MPPMPQPLVFRNPRTGRKSLYIASHIAEIVGWPTAEARKLAGELIALATEPGRVYTHAWRPGDLVIWDDRATMHRRCPYDDLSEVRKLHTMRVIEPSELYDPAVRHEIH
jgi:alpha-ketoglutarate-dependent 2,4-dichlorophenoxyacetate dioxygenase